MTAVTRQAKRLLSCFGGPDNIHVSADLGAEQEYFLVDKQLYALRPDLMMCGRTLFGNVPPKHQQMEDHYFGSIKDRVLEFMVDVDEALWKLGIPAKTRHNEVAPGQFEIAPILKARTWPWTIICWSWRCSGKPPTSMTWSACCMKSPSPA